MLTVRHGRPETTLTLQRWYGVHRPTIVGHALWSVALLCVAVLGRAMAGAPGAIDIASLGGGLL